MKRSHPTNGGLFRAARRLLRDDAAVSAVFFAVTLSSTVGVVGLGVETGLWFAERRQYQTAADAGAIAGALQMVSQLNANNSATPTLDVSATGSAWTEAIRNGASTFVLNTSVQQKSSPTRAHVEVSEQKNTLFAALSSLTSVTINTVAEAKVDVLGRPCINGLGGTGTAITIQGSATVSAPNCVITSNSIADENSPATDKASVSIQGGTNTKVDVAQIYSIGSIYTGGNPDLGAPLGGMAPSTGTADPFSSVAVPTAPTAPTITTVTAPGGGCQTVPGSGGAIPAGVMCKSGKSTAGDVSLSGHAWTVGGISYVSGNLTIASGASLNVGSSGTLYVLGDLSVPGSLSVSATGTLYVNGNVTSGGTMTLNSGLTVANTSNKPHTVTISGGTTSVTGAVKIAKGDLSVSGGTATVSGNVNLGSGNLSISGGTTTLTGNVGLTTGNFSVTGGTTTLNGTATVVGSFSIGSSGSISGTSASILLSGSTGSFDVNSNSHVNLTAPTSGTYKGIVFYQDPASTNASNIGGGHSTIVGAIYAKNGTVNFGGNSGSACTVIVAKQVNFSGNSSLDTSGCSTYVTLPTFYKVSLFL